VELTAAIKRRRMCRDFETRPIDAALVHLLLDLARRVPSAGFTQGFHLLTLEGPDQTKRFWDLTLPLEARATFGYPGLLRAPLLVLPLADPQAYVTRYAEPDKAQSGLGEGADRWPVPYWWADTAMAVQNLLLACTDHGLGALYFGIFRNEAEVLAELGVPTGLRPVGAVAIGYPTPDALAQLEGSPRTRTRRPLDQIVHRNGWHDTPTA
jgi:nitroreductase